MNQPYLQYPSDDATNADVLTDSLGYFWNNVFRERKTVRGWTFAQAEQVVQQYYQLEAAVNSLAGRSLPVFNQVRRFPLIVKKSEITNDQPVFGDGSSWGAQPSGSDPLFEGLTFKFGRARENNSDLQIFSWRPPKELHSFALIADRLVAPQHVFVNRVDTRLVNGSISWKIDPFSLPGVEVVPLFNQDGTPAMFSDADNRIEQDAVLVLWAYEAEVDQQAAAVAFGWLFGVFQPSSDTYGQVLRGLIELYANGPSVNKLKSAVAAFLGVKPVVSDGEVVEHIYQFTPAGHAQTTLRVVQTDQNIYTADGYFQVLPFVKIGAVLEAGDVLFDVVEYYDVLEDPTWWQTKVVPKISKVGVAEGSTVTTSKMSFAPSLFAGGCTGELVFNNDMELFTQDASGGLHFPVHGSTADVTRFNDQLNENADLIADAVGLTPGGSVVVNPLDFLFNNFLKSGTALVKINFKNIAQAELLTSAFKHVKDALPRNVLFIFFLDFTVPVDSYAVLNGTTPVTLNGSTVTTNADGSTSTGWLTEETAPNYRTNVKTRLFALSKGVTHTQLQVAANSGSFPANDLLVKAGGLLTDIPVGKTTREVNNLLLMNLS